MSEREPCTYTLRELGSGLTAASSTWAFWLENGAGLAGFAGFAEFGRAAFMVLLLGEMSGVGGTPASLRWHYPPGVRVFLTGI